MISIIIPVYNEAKVLETNINKICSRISKKKLALEIIVVDGESTDETAKIASELKSVQLISAPKSRPRQMNFGAKQAKYNILYFLHIDSFPPKNFDILILNAIENGHEAGCFKMKFRSQHPWLKFISWLTKFEARSCRGGDQSLFISKSLFENIGGYDEKYLIYEDHEILDPIYKKSDFKVIQQWISTSARRFQNKGILKLQLLFWMIYFKKWSGATPEELYDFYLKKIDN
ncbi:MAG: TIGR04283 family arsenosugar biosynthesis glycosyltransferase [Psychroflexus sp.]